MGLLDRSKRLVEIPAQPEGKQKDTVTQENLSISPDFFFPVFHSFAEELGLDKIAVLFNINNNYHMLLDHGFDYQTVLLNTYAPDFWLSLSATITPNQWYTYKFKDLEPFAQLFSDEEINSINTIYLKLNVIESQQWIVVIAKSSLAPDKNNIDLISLDLVFSEIQTTFFQMSLFFCSHLSRKTEIQDIDSSINNGLENNRQAHTMMLSLKQPSQTLNILQEIDIKILFLHFSFFLYSCLPQSALISFDNNDKIKVVLFSKDILDAQMLQIQFNTICARFFSTSNAIELTVTDCTVETDIQQIKTFFLP